MALKIIADNPADTAALSASPSMAPALPADNLQTDDGRPARSLSPSSQIVAGTWSAAQTVSAVALWRHTLTTEASWRVELFAGAGLSGTRVYDSGDTALGVAALYFDAVSARSFRLTLQDAGNPAGCFDIGRLVVGAAWTPSEAPDYGATVRWLDPVELAHTDAGSVFHPGGPAPFRELSFSLSDLPETDRAALFGLVEQGAAGGNFWVSVYAGAGGVLEGDHALWGRPVAPSGLDAVGWARYTGKLAVQEVA